MSVKIKICGLRRREDIEIVNRYLPDFAGFIFARGRRRYVPPQAVAELVGRLDERITPVGVFVNEPPDDLLAIADIAGVRVIQLHGQEDADYIRELKKRTGRQIVKAIAIPDAAQAEQAVLAACSASPDMQGEAGMAQAIKMYRLEALRQAEASPADVILLDSGRGGTGESFGWDMLTEASRPFFLAGGLTPGNVAEALDFLSPYERLLGVDISSGSETEGVKDEAKVRELVAQVKGFVTGAEA